MRAIGYNSSSGGKVKTHITPYSKLALIVVIYKIEVYLMIFEPARPPQPESKS